MYQVDCEHFKKYYALFLKDREPLLVLLTAMFSRLSFFNELHHKQKYFLKFRPASFINICKHFPTHYISFRLISNLSVLLSPTLQHTYTQQLATENIQISDKGLKGFFLSDVTGLQNL